jgi:hypothetical protein
MSRMRKRIAFSSVIVVSLATVAGLIILSQSSGGDASRAVKPTPTPTPFVSAPIAHPSSAPPVFAIYYMWWDRQHWVTRLGPSYPVSARPNPMPATLNDSGCATVNAYPGNALTDVSQGLTYDQSNPATIRHDVELAARSGLNGFMVNWIGTGSAQQSATSSNYNRRLQYMFDATHAVNAEGLPFRLILNYQSSAKRLTPAQFANDLGYFFKAYGADAALDHSYSKRPEVVMAGTWKYSDATLAGISASLRPRLYLIGDEKPASWNAARASSLDGTSYYWSSENPITNKSAFAKLAAFATLVRKTRNPDGSIKTWLAPFTPGYNAMLLYHTSTCVPRDDGATMKTLFVGNAASKPAGWTLISWNEISEGSYVVPLSRYGNHYLDVLTALLKSR